jgi:hypothetical protein
MFDQPSHDKQAYRLESAFKQLDLGSQKALTDLIKEHNIRTFIVGRTRLLPAFEMDRLMLILMRQEVQREFTEGHGTGVSSHG